MQVCAIWKFTINAGDHQAAKQYFDMHLQLKCLFGILKTKHKHIYFHTHLTEFKNV